MTRFEIRIDELVLRGVPREQAAEVTGQVEARLRALAAAGSAEGMHGGSRDAVRTRPIQAEPTALGNAVADRVWSAVSGAQGGLP